MPLRDFQVQLENEVFQAWNEGALNVCMTAPTGSGKTVIIGDITVQMDVPTVAIAHRQELLGQLAAALNRENVPHGLIAPKAAIQQIIAFEMETHGYSRYNPRANVRVASVDTIIKRDASDRFFSQCQLAIIDEGHHVQIDNKWDTALKMLPNARALLPTAHAIRADGGGLGRPSLGGTGVVDKLVVGPSARDLINRGYLVDYEILCPPSHINRDEVSIGPSGEYNQKKLRAAVHQDGAIVGDVVQHYMRHAAGKLGITFVVDIESASEMARAYQACDIPSAVITANTPLNIRSNFMRKFRNRQLLQLISVDVLGEGVDVPAVEVISMVRPTASFQLYSQQFGRALRLLLPDAQTKLWDQYTDEQRLQIIAGSPKPRALILDHVGNCQHFFKKHGMVDSRQQYSLAKRASRSGAGDAIPLRICIGTPKNPGCLKPYPAVKPKCPYCAIPYVPSGRSKPDEVDGDLILLDPEVLAQMYANVRKIDGAPMMPTGVDHVVALSIRKRHIERQQAQASLRRTIQLWAGWQRDIGREDQEIYRQFYFAFDTDILTAQTLGVPEAAALQAKIQAKLDENLIVEKL